MCEKYYTRVSCSCITNLKKKKDKMHETEKQKEVKMNEIKNVFETSRLYTQINWLVPHFLSRASSGCIGGCVAMSNLVVPCDAICSYV
jgi:hypothetical protein